MPTLLPYPPIMRTNDFLEMVQAQCETCEFYQESRPSCRIVQGYYRGELSGISPAAWGISEDGQRVCRNRNEHTPPPKALSVFGEGPEKEKEKEKENFPSPPPDRETVGKLKNSIFKKD